MPAAPCAETYGWDMRMQFEPVKRAQARNSQRYRLALCAGLSALLGVGYAAEAAAQTMFDRDGSADVLARAHPEYDALGIAVQSFTIYPTLELGATYDDNIYGLPTKTGDVVGVVKPTIRIASDWGRNALGLTLNSEFDPYLDHSSEDAAQYSAEANGRIDVDHASTISIQAGDALITEPRTAPDSVAALRKPVQYTDGNASVSGYREFDRLRISASVHYTTLNYQNVPLDNGVQYDEKSRDETILSESVRADYAVSPNLALFVSATPNQAMFVQQPPTVPLDYNSTGYELLTGVNFQITHLITGEIGVGYYNQRYADKAFSTVGGADYNASIKYYVTQLMTLTFRAQHQVAGSGIPQSPSTNINGGSATIDYELLRNVVLSGTGGVSIYDYPGLSRTDKIYNAGLRATYRLNRIVSIAARYNYLNQNSVGSGRGFNFDDNQIGLSLLLQR
jgi:hypothetical protein